VTVSGQDMIVLRQLGRSEAEPVRGTEDAALPFFSPDGAWIGFTAGGKLKKVRVEGGAPIVPGGGELGRRELGARRHHRLYPSYKSGLWRVSAGGGTAERLTTPDSAAGELAHWWPQFLPDGRHVVFTNYSTPVERAKIELLDLRTGERKVLVRAASSAATSPPGSSCTPAASRCWRCRSISGAWR
jgi:hypothetical protein